jgi:uncharacterized membrane protein YdfJ with MMPL/SSD domain
MLQQQNYVVRTIDIRDEGEETHDASLKGCVLAVVLGVGTDYTIFLISRFREEVSRGDWHAASQATVKRIGAVITASAATVIVGLGSMAFGQFQMIQTTGPALAIAIYAASIWILFQPMQMRGMVM